MCDRESNRSENLIKYDKRYPSSEHRPLRSGKPWPVSKFWSAAYFYKSSFTGT